MKSAECSSDRTFRIRSYNGGDEEEIVELWNLCLLRDPITLEVFERKVLLDPNFDPEGCLIAEEGRRIIGFILALVRKFPMYSKGLEEDRGWITALFVHPEHRGKGVGDALLQGALSYLRSNGRKEAWFSPYTPNYFNPGVDIDAYPEGVKFLEKHGFSRVYTALAMSGHLWPDFKVPEEVQTIEEQLRREGIVVQFLQTKYIYAFLKFLLEKFGGDWYRHSLEMLQRGCAKDQILIAVKDGREVVGYCQYFNGEGYDWEKPGEHFGPFGVREDMRGRGVGTLLLFKCLERMRQREIHHVFLLWTEERAAKLYRRAGLEVARRYAIMKNLF